MAVMHFSCEQWVPSAQTEVFAFFSEARNLEALTPPWLRFQVLTPAPIHLRRGTTIDYGLRVHGVPIRWRSAITVWNPPYEFVDEQERGPYRRWVHTHTFASERGGTTVRDAIEFEVPLPWLTSRFVARDVRRIFEYRRAALARQFRPATDAPQ